MLLPKSVLSKKILVINSSVSFFSKLWVKPSNSHIFVLFSSFLQKLSISLSIPLLQEQLMQKTQITQLSLNYYFILLFLFRLDKLLVSLSTPLSKQLFVPKTYIIPLFSLLSQKEILFLLLTLISIACSHWTPGELLDTLSFFILSNLSHSTLSNSLDILAVINPE